jgi:indolepyruvate decarboxylase
MLGCFMTDINLGVYTARLDPDRTIYATSEKTTIRHHSFEDVPFRSFFRALLDAPLRRRARPSVRRAHLRPLGRRRDGERITMKTLFALLDGILTEDMVVISDVGSCTFSAIDLQIRKQTEFLCPAYYTSMGFGVPASLGAQMARPSLRPLVLVGDGAFQMTGLELSTAVRLGLSPVVVVLNNHGYTTERTILDGPFNDILDWSYRRVPELLNSGNGFLVRTIGEARQSLEAALSDRENFSIIEVDLDPYDTSPALRRLGQQLGKQDRRPSARRRSRTPRRRAR